VDKLERLMNLTAAMLETVRPLSADELRERVPGYPDDKASFRRAFERDKEDLRELGIPISLAPVEGTDPPIEGYLIRKEEYYLDDPGLETDELAALNLAQSAVQLEGVEGIDAIAKLGGVVGPGLDPEATGLASLRADPALVPLFGAVLERRTVRFAYRAREGAEERTVDPYRLDYQGGHWYLSGHDRGRDGERHFRLDRVVGEVTAGPPGGFDRPATEVPGVPRAGWQLGAGEPVVARLLVDADQARWAAQHLGADAVAERRADGSVEFDVVVTNWPAFRSFVLSFLEHAELLAPDDMRAELVSWLQALAGERAPR